MRAAEPICSRECALAQQPECEGMCVALAQAPQTSDAGARTFKGREDCVIETTSRREHSDDECLGHTLTQDSGTPL